MECMKPFRDSPTPDNNICRFLLAQLHFDSLAVQDNRRNLRSALERLPENLGETYDEAMRRIQCQSLYQWKRAFQVLAWISYAVRPLHVEELQHALSVEAGDIDFDEEALPDIDSIISVCGGLVAIDGASSIIRLVHYTTQQYFERTREKFFPLGHQQIAETCITYLCYEAFTSGPLHDLAEFDLRLLNYDFLNYSAQFWGDHAREGSQQKLKNIILDFFSHHGNLACAFQMTTIGQYHIPYKYALRHSPIQVHPIYIAASFGLTLIVKLLLEQGAELEAADTQARTALHWAIINNHEETVNLLLDWGADIRARSKAGETALRLAIGREYNPITCPLPNGGATINPAALHEAVPTKSEAAYKRRESMVQLLLDRGANVKESEFSWSSRTYLHNAATQGQEKIVKLLLDNNANVDSCDDSLMTPLHYAALGGHTEVMRLLLSRGANINAADSTGASALHFAATRGHTEVIRLLLNRGANVHATDKSKSSALHCAATDFETGVDMAKLLLKQRADVDAESVYGETALYIAARVGNGFMLSVLLDHGAAISGSRNAKWTPLHEATFHGQDTIVKLLLDRGADIDAKDRYGKTAVECVTYQRRHIPLPRKKEEHKKIE